MAEKQVGVPFWVADCLTDLTPEKTFLIAGALGSGKTTGAAIITLDRWLLNRDSLLTWIVAPTFTRAEQIVLPALRQVMSDFYGMTDGNEYRIAGGKFLKLTLKGYPHEIHILSGERPDLFVGANISFFWVTEPGLMKREVYEKLNARLRCPKAVVRQSILEGSPEGMSGNGAWWYEVCQVDGTGYDRDDTARNKRRFTLETRMNRHLQPSPEVYLKRLQEVYAYDPSKLRSYTLGEFVPFTKGTAYFEFVESRNVVPNIDPDPALTVQLSFDFNIVVAFVALQRRHTQAHYYAPRRMQDVAIHESSGEARGGLMDAVAEFAVKFPVADFRNTLIQIDGDASGWARSHKIQGSDYERIEQYLRALGYQRIEVVAPRQNPLVRQRLELTAALMAYEQHTVCARCTRLITGYVKTTLKENSWELVKDANDQHTHWPDAAGYYLYRANKDRDIVNPNARPVLGIG